MLKNNYATVEEVMTTNVRWLKFKKFMRRHKLEIMSFIYFGLLIAGFAVIGIEILKP